MELLLSLVLGLFASGVALILPKTCSKPDYMLDCSDGKTLPAVFKNMSFDVIGRNKFAVNALLVVNEKISSTIKMTYEITKCIDKQKVDSCKYYVSSEFANVCMELPKKNAPWTSFLAKITNLVPKCPIKTGVYLVDNAPVEAEKDTSISFGAMQGYWKFKIQVIDGRREIMCVKFAVENKRC